MRTNRWRGLRTMLPILIGAIACHDDEATAPPGAIVGRWGGVNAELVAGARSVTVQFGCGPLTSTGALIPDAAGHFFTTFPMREIHSSALYIVEGTVQGDMIRFRIVSHPMTGVRETEFAVRRNAPADFRTTACAALGL